MIKYSLTKGLLHHVFQKREKTGNINLASESLTNGKIIRQMAKMAGTIYTLFYTRQNIGE